jgi:hypothetical protein
MNKIALEDARQHAGYVIPTAPSVGRTAMWHCARKTALILAAVYVALALGEPWLLQNAPPSPHEVVVTRSGATGTLSGSENASPARSAPSFE